MDDNLSFFQMEDDLNFVKEGVLKENFVFTLFTLYYNRFGGIF